MSVPTIFIWGYWGWGNSTKQLVEAVDAAERSRCFNPPYFVDIRIRRSGKAPGFNGSKFEKLLGPDRYRWMYCLGNLRILDGGEGVKIKDPSAAPDLLELALTELKRRQRRTIFFCACASPERARICHRATVARYVLNVAKKQGQPLEIIEWPGGDPKTVEVKVTLQTFKAIQRGRSSIPLGNRTVLAEFAGLPWGSTATVTSNGETLKATVGPALFERNAWILPIYEFGFEVGDEKLRGRAARLRRTWGLDRRLSLA
jgi:hypothetical protein